MTKTTLGLPMLGLVEQTSAAKVFHKLALTACFFIASPSYSQSSFFEDLNSIASMPENLASQVQEQTVYVHDRNGNAIGTGIKGSVIRRLNLQHDMDKNLPFNNAMFFGTHNSYSTKRYSEVKRYVNQSNDVIAQLNVGARAINFDLFQDRINASSQGFDMETCHTWNGAFCDSGGRRMYHHLREIREWLEENPDEVVVIVFETFITSGETDDAAALLANTEYLGNYHLRARDASADGKNFSNLTKEYIRSQGKNIVYVCSNCGSGDTKVNWDNIVFDMPSGTISKKGNDAKDISPGDAANKYAILYEDRLFGGGGANELTGTELYNGINHRAYNMVGLDYFINENRFNALMWSWADGYPKSFEHNCAISDHAYPLYGQSDQWRSADCSNLVLPAACVSAGTGGNHSRWEISAPTTFENAHEACEIIGKVFRAPQTAYENYWVRDAKKKSGDSVVMLNYVKQGWTDSDWTILPNNTPLPATNKKISALISIL